MTLGGCLRMWLIVFFVEAVCMLAFVSPEKVRAVIAAEVEDSRVRLGAEDTERIVQATNQTFGDVFEATPDIDAGISDDRLARGVEQLKIAIRLRLEAVVYLIAYRLSWLRAGLLPVAFISIAAGVDGLVVRRRRAYAFSSTSTSAFGAGAFLVLSVSMLPLLYLIAPVRVPVLALPLAGLAFSGAVWLICAHLPGAGTIRGLNS
jgi:hypothetical protein